MVLLPIPMVIFLQFNDLKVYGNDALLYFEEKIIQIKFLWESSQDKLLVQFD